LSAPVRFLVIVVGGWAAVRAVTLGALPGLTVSYAKELPAASALPPIAATQFPPIPAVEMPPAQEYVAANPRPYPVMMAMPAGYYSAYPYPYATIASSEPITPRPQWHLPSSQTLPASSFYAPAEEDWQLASLTSLPARRSPPVPVLPAQPPLQQKLDRLQMTSWAMLRGAPSPGTLASGGTLGGSQAGARLTYAFNRWVAASVRTTSPVGGSTGAEIAGGLRFTPLRSIPVTFTVERRQSISPHGGGRSAFAVFAEGGLYHERLPWQFNLDAYVQAGLVGFNSRDFFADGAFAFTRPVWRQFSAGFGVWGGVQPGVYRIDAGPRVSMKVRKNIYAHLDWRQRVAGSTQPSSGPALTLAADF
jgi:hypothetical protein